MLSGFVPTMIFVPLLIFAAKPESLRWWRLLRLLLVIAVSIGIMWVDYLQESQAILTALNDPHSKIPHTERPYPESWSFRLYFITLLTLVHLGFWEFIWRIWHHKALTGFFRGVGDCRLINIIFTGSFILTVFWGSMISLVLLNHVPQ